MRDDERRRFGPRRGMRFDHHRAGQPGGRTLEERLLEENRRMAVAIVEALDHFSIAWDTDVPDAEGVPIDWRYAAHRMAMTLRDGLPEGDQA